jgi:gamma-glutamyltranspeptidase/glutathione hydrolase
VADGDGNACVLTTSLGLGSGDFLPGLDVHLNSMLGETDLVRGRLEPGERMGSMMAPSVALDEGGLVLAVGAAGGTRLRSALLQVVAGILDEGLEPGTAVERPRLHPAAGVVHLEPGFDPEVPAALGEAGYEVRAWPSLHHFFGGVSVVGRAGCAGDPRRSGGAQALTRG